MYELYLIKVPETLDSKVFMHPVTIMTRAPVGNTNKYRTCILNKKKIKSKKIDFI